MTHPTHTYALDVVEGRIPAGRLVRLACERHLRDLEEGGARGLYFDEREASIALDFAELLPQSKGEWGGKALVLQGWQKFRIGSVFGWRQADGRRRFRRAFNEVARKNGKSTEAAAIGNILAWIDEEPGAEVYVAATKREQARIVWGESKYQMTHTAPGGGHKNLARQLGVTTQVANMNQSSTRTKYEPLGRDVDSTDGLNPHGLVIDELHAWLDREYFGKLLTAQGARRQPLVWMITTAGVEGSSLCREEHDYAVKVLEGVVEDDTYFAYIATVDDPARWGDEDEWAKANPNLGVSVKLDFLRTEYAAALEKPAQQSVFQRFFLDIWVGAEQPWVTLTLWDSQAPQRSLDELVGADCYMGIDLSSTGDLTALALWFPDGAEAGDLHVWYWMPRDNVPERVRRDRVPYDVWIEGGLIEPVPGRAINYDFIKRKALELAGRFRVRCVGIDPWTAEQLGLQLEAGGLDVYRVPQQMSSLTAPTREIERLLAVGGYRHGGNPVLRWNAANAVAVQDANENRRLDKRRSRERIDGLSAAVDAMKARTWPGVPSGVPAVYFWPDEDDG